MLAEPSSESRACNTTRAQAIEAVDAELARLRAAGAPEDALRSWTEHRAELVRHPVLPPPWEEWPLVREAGLPGVRRDATAADIDRPEITAAAREAILAGQVHTAHVTDPDGGRERLEIPVIDMNGQTALWVLPIGGPGR